MDCEIAGISHCLLVCSYCLPTTFLLQVEAPLSRSSPTSSDTSQIAPLSAFSISSSRNPKDALRHRIFHLSELLRVEKANRDENISCYLELVSKADREKAPSIRQAFERINQRSSANIAHLEQRLQDSWNQLRKVECRILSQQDSSTSAASALQQFFTPKSSFSRQKSFDRPQSHSTESASTEEIQDLSPRDILSCSPVEISPKQVLDEASKEKLQEFGGQLEELRTAQQVLEDEWQKLEEAWRLDKHQMMDLLQEEKRRWASAFLRGRGPNSHPFPQ